MLEAGWGEGAAGGDYLGGDEGAEHGGGDVLEPGTDSGGARAGAERDGGEWDGLGKVDAERHGDEEWELGEEGAHAGRSSAVAARADGGQRITRWAKGPMALAIRPAKRMCQPGGRRSTPTTPRMAASTATRALGRVVQVRTVRA